MPGLLFQQYYYCFDDDLLLKSLFLQETIKRGILTNTSIMISYAHKEADIHRREKEIAELKRAMELERAELKEERAERKAECNHRGHKRHRGPKPADGDDRTGADSGEESIIIDGDAARTTAATAVQSTSWGALKSGQRR